LRRRDVGTLREIASGQAMLPSISRRYGLPAGMAHGFAPGCVLDIRLINQLVEPVTGRIERYVEAIDRDLSLEVLETLRQRLSPSHLASRLRIGFPFRKQHRAADRPQVLDSFKQSKVKDEGMQRNGPL